MRKRKKVFDVDQGHTRQSTLSARPVAGFGYVRFWHLADMTRAAADVRYRG
jgi:hypothetical protein